MSALSYRTVSPSTNRGNCSLPPTFRASALCLDPRPHGFTSTTRSSAVTALADEAAVGVASYTTEHGRRLERTGPPASPSTTVVLLPAATGILAIDARPLAATSAALTKGWRQGGGVVLEQEQRCDASRWRHSSCVSVAKAVQECGTRQRLTDVVQ